MAASETSSTDASRFTAVSSSAFRTAPLTRAAVAGFFVVGLAACGGGSADIAVEEAPTTTIADADFIGAGDSEESGESEDSIPEALADADADVVDTADDVAENPDEEADVTADNTGDETADEAEGEGDEPDTAIDSESPPSPADAEGVHAVYSGGKLYLRGSVPSDEIADAVVVAAEQVLGSGNVINEYVIDPASDFESGSAASIFLADTILFESGSAEVGEDFVEAISILPLLMAIQPDVTIWAFGYTDSDGADDLNLRLSQQRVDAVRDWVIERGGDPERIIATGLGEDNPVADNATPEGRAENRRVEFRIEGFDIGI